MMKLAHTWLDAQKSTETEQRSVLIVKGHVGYNNVFTQAVPDEDLKGRVCLYISACPDVNMFWSHLC